MSGTSTRGHRAWSRGLVALFVASLALVGSAAMTAFADTKGSGPGTSGSVPGSASAQAGEVGAAAVGGPIVIMGIDAEDGGVDAHGPIANYVDVVNSLLTNATNGGSGILVIGGGKDPTDDVTTFWDAIGTGTGQTVTYVNGASNITAQSFAGFKVLAVVSGDDETSDGGLTAAESEALAARQADVAAFVNGGGGLLAFAQDFTDPTTSNYGFLGGIGSFTFTTGLGYDAIAPTADGTAIGITDDLDICCWHDTYQTFPPFLKVLANDDDPTDDGFGQVAALGGAKVVIGPQPEEPITPAAEAVTLIPAFTG